LTSIVKNLSTQHSFIFLNGMNRYFFFMYP